MKKFNSFPKAKKMVELFLEGTFGEKSFVMHDFAIDMKGVRANNIIGHNLYLAVRENGTQGLYWDAEKAEMNLRSWSDPYAVVEFSYIPEEHMFAVKMNKVVK